MRRLKGKKIKPPIERKNSSSYTTPKRTRLRSFSSALARLASSLALALSDFSLGGSSAAGGGGEASCFFDVDQKLFFFFPPLSIEGEH